MRKGFRFWLVWLGFWLLLWFGLGLRENGLQAQSYGRNKVQYETFDFKVMQTKHFDVYFYPEMRAAAEQAARMAERWYARFARVLNHELEGRQPLILYSSSPHFQQTAAIPGVIGEGVGGVTEMFKRRIVLPLGASLAASDHVIGHELVHAFQFDITSQGHSSYASAAPTALRLPLWLVEGMAEYLTIGPQDAHTAMWMRDAAYREKLPTIKKMSNPRYFPYRYGQSLWAYITGKYGDGAVARVIKAASRIGSYEAAIQRALGVSIEVLSQQWHQSIQAAYQPVLARTQLTDASSQALIPGSEENVLNVSPALSPDGSKIILLSTKDLFSIDMYLVDTRSGRFEKKLVSTAVDPHFESLQFIKSSGSWDSKSRRFVFGAIRKGQPVLTLFNMNLRRKVREVPFPELGEILSPTWSPDGRYIAFSAQVQGLSDLFIYDLIGNELRQLTNDAFADLQPAWSPDGRSIAFVTERFSSDLTLLSIGHMELATIDIATGEISRIPGFTGAKNINPQWAPDSHSLFFLSDQNGISNVYEVDLHTRKIMQVTDLFTGISGITEMSPAISIAKDSGHMAYSLYENGQYSIYTLGLDEIEAMKKPPVSPQGKNPSILPPRDEASGELHELIQNPLFGLPDETEYPVEDYQSKMKLDYITQPQLAIGTDRFGTTFGGGLALMFSDMLGYRNLSTVFQVNGRLIDSAFVLGFQNSRKRLNWGAALQRIPYIYGGFNAGEGEVLGQLAYMEQETIFRQIYYQLMGFAAYPFSQVKRFELSSGVRLIDYDSEVRMRAYSLIDGAPLLETVEKLESPDSLHMAFANASLIYDSAIYGATAPILGQSYILQVSPLTGSLSYVGVLADYRRYVMPVRPFSLAFRLLHYGRYGKGGEDPRLYPLFLGYENLVRGYNTNSFSMDEFPDNDFSRFDQLFGSKILIANVELRFPLFQVLGIGKGYYGILPIDFTTFFDAGLAWFDSGDDRAFFLGGERRPVASIGVGLRMNVFGYMIFGVAFVRPLDRPGRRPYLQFTLTPGF